LSEKRKKDKFKGKTGFPLTVSVAKSRRRISSKQRRIIEICYYDRGGKQELPDGKQVMKLGACTGNAGFVPKKQTGGCRDEKKKAIRGDVKTTYSGKGAKDHKFLREHQLYRQKKTTVSHSLQIGGGAA